MSWFSNIENLLAFLYEEKKREEISPLITLQEHYPIPTPTFNPYSEIIKLKKGSFVHRESLLDGLSTTEEIDESDEGFTSDRLVATDENCLYFKYGNVRYCVNIADIVQTTLYRRRNEQ